MKNNVKLFLIIFLVLLLVVAVASFSWFSKMDSVSIDSANNMNVQVGHTLQIRHRNGSNLSEWGGELKLNKDLNIVDCTGDGVTFYVPELVNENGVAAGGDNMKPLDGNLRGYVIDTYVDLRSGNDVDVYLGSESRISPSEDAVASPEIEGMSANGIAGCIRVAFFEVTYDSNGNPSFVGGTPIFVWAPNAKMELSGEGKNLTFTENGTPESTYQYYGENGETTYTVQDYLNGTFVTAENTDLCVAGSDVAIPSINQSPRLLSFRTTENGAMQEKHLLIRMWFEGTDREANSAFDGGKVDFHFSFEGIAPKTERSQEQEDAAKATLVPTATGTGWGLGSTYEPGAFIYSTNGLTWQPLGAGAIFGNSQTVYVRLAETPEYTQGQTVYTFQKPAA